MEPNSTTTSPPVVLSNVPGSRDPCDLRAPFHRAHAPPPPAYRTSSTTVSVFFPPSPAPEPRPGPRPSRRPPWGRRGRRPGAIGGGGRGSRAGVGGVRRGWTSCRRRVADKRPTKCRASVQEAKTAVASGEEEEEKPTAAGKTQVSRGDPGRSVG